MRQLIKLILIIPIVSTALCIYGNATAQPERRSAMVRPVFSQQLQPSSRSERANPIIGKTPRSLPFYKEPWFIALIAGAVILALKMARKLVPSREAHTTTGRLADEKELLAAYQCDWGMGGYMLGRLPPRENASLFAQLFSRAGRPGSRAVLRLRPEERLSHLIIQAGPGAGKTTACFIPQLVEDAYSGAFNAYLVDRKAPELYQMLYKVWSDRGHRVIYFDPWRPELTHGFEPLLDATDADIESMVQVFVTVSPDPESSLRHYRDQERHILRRLLRAAQDWGKCRGPAQGLHCRCEFNYEHHVTNRTADPGWDCGCRCRRHFCTLPAVADLLLKGWRATQAAIQAVRPDLNEELADIWEIQITKLAELFAGLAAKLELFRQPGPRAAFSRRDFTFADIVPPIQAGTQIQRTLLIVGAPQSQQDHAGLLASLMTQFLAEQIYLRRDDMAANGCRWTDVVPVSVFLDEFGTYGISRIDDFVATARSGAAGVVAALQNQEQLTQFYGSYGRSAVTAMLTNFRTHVFLKGCHSRVAAELSERTGTKLVSDEISHTSRSAEPTRLLPRSFSRGEQTRPVEVPVLTPDAIEFMPESEAIIVGWTKPAKIELVRYYEDSRIEPWVRESQTEVALRARQNAECDGNQQQRPAGEPRRLPNYPFDWSLIPGVRQAILREEGADRPLSRDQKGVILAKARDLEMSDEELGGLARETCYKPLDKYTKADARTLIEELEDLEQKRGIVPPSKRKEGQSGFRK